MLLILSSHFVNFYYSIVQCVGFIYTNAKKNILNGNNDLFLSHFAFCVCDETNTEWLIFMRENYIGAKNWCVMILILNKRTIVSIETEPNNF